MTANERNTLLQGLESLHLLIVQDKKPAAMFAASESYKNIQAMQQCDQCGDYFQAREMDGRFCGRCVAVQESVSGFDQDDVIF